MSPQEKQGLVSLIVCVVLGLTFWIVFSNPEPQKPQLQTVTAQLTAQMNSGY